MLQSSENFGQLSHYLRQSQNSQTLRLRISTQSESWSLDDPNEASGKFGVTWEESSSDGVKPAALLFHHSTTLELRFNLASNSSCARTRFAVQSLRFAMSQLEFFFSLSMESPFTTSAID